MTTLDKTLAGFVHALRGGPEAGTQLFGQTAGGVSAYANNLLFNRADALADAYPVVRQLVGDEFFGGMARAYARVTPSNSGDLHRYGANFAEFIEGFAPAAELPYLPEAARLDWLCQLAYFAADHASFDFERLAAIPADRHGALQFGLAPAVGLLQSAWPVASLWRAHRPEGDADWGDFPSPDQGGERVLCWRDGRHRVHVKRLGAADHAFLDGCRSGLPLCEALERALDADMEFDLGVSLQGWILDQVIVEFTESPSP